VPFTMAKMFAKASTAMSIESRYVEGKARGFKHNPEVHDQLAILKIQKQEVSALKKNHKAFSGCYKKIGELCDKGAKEFLFFITEGRQNPKLGTVYNMYADFLTKASEARTAAYGHLNLVNEEWKFLSKNDLKQIETKLDQANKALVSRQYYESSKDNHNAREFDGKYATFITDFVKLLHELREKKESLHPQFVLRSLQAEIILTKQLLKEVELCAAAVLQLGPVDPIRAEPFRLVPRDPYPMSEEEKKKLHPENKNPYAQASPQTSNPYGQTTTVVTQTYSQPLPTPLPQQSRFPQCRALFQFNASSPQELSFNVGDILNLLSTDGAWWTAELLGRQGMIPSNYVERI